MYIWLFVSRLPFWYKERSETGNVHTVFSGIRAVNEPEDAISPERLLHLRQLGTVDPLALPIFHLSVEVHPEGMDIFGGLDPLRNFVRCPLRVRGGARQRYQIMFW